MGPHHNGWSLRHGYKQTSVVARALRDSNRRRKEEVCKLFRRTLTSPPSPLSSTICQFFALGGLNSSLHHRMSPVDDATTVT
ncbi:hypothetical protein Hypma_013841 [Hypsizygus marmoreus]|uniref:Uncharacterized protein n=1 Tax=Hypsizygus marmoreus TaxID=39966 RepID=A0A369KE57_HYPMA|nr:hypothetical protein Hypma_013841 [Hypsizygus marmoreus]